MSLLKTVGLQMQYPKGFLGKLLFAWMTPKTIEHAQWTNDLLDIQPKDNIIEIGFGNGANIELLLQEAIKGSVTGVELSKTAIDMAAKKNAKAISEGRVILHLAPGNALPCEDNVFDIACSVATAYVIKDMSGVFKEMFRVLKPNGRAAVTFPIRENFMRFKPVVSTEGFYMHELTDLESEFQNAGFVNCKTKRNNQVKFGSDCMLGEKPVMN